ncbi:MAG: adenine phosphoribosyltransferase [Lachnospiraceae bacterium]|nr:adenine phosphoribosyltransferase [Lachnospiraceae bacterium]
MKKLEEYVRTIPDFPKEGIMFRDITTILQDADGFHMAVDEMIKLAEDVDFDVVVGLEARGFVLGAPMAYVMNKEFALIRKQGKLPYETISQDFELEYGKATIEIQTDSVKPGQKVVLVDDLIATGGTLAASVSLVERLGGEVAAILCLMELKGLKGRDILSGYDVRSVISFEGK